VRVHLVQHGEAKPESEDPERSLTTQGAALVAWVAREAVAALGVRPRRVVHSGRARARQTAELWAALVGCPVESADGLGPTDDPAVWSARLAASAVELDGLMLVGHLPHLGRLTGLLVAGDAERPVVRFRQGGLVVLEQGDAGWEVAAVLPPDVGTGAGR
jgi:phosphohistidine phosphatase